MLDRSPQPNLFDPGRDGAPDPQRMPAPQAVSDDFAAPRSVPSSRWRRPSPATYLNAARAALSPAVSARLRASACLRLLAPAAILVLLLVVDPAGCSRNTTTRVVARVITHDVPPRMLTTSVTRTVTVQAPAPPTPPQSGGASPASVPAQDFAGVTQQSSAPAAHEPAPAAAPSPAVASPRAGATESSPDPRREESGEEFGFER